MDFFIKHRNNNNNNNKTTNVSYLRNVYCVNCGEKGHVLKECTGPITSFGIIAFKNCKNEDDTKFDTNNHLKNILNQFNITNKRQAEYPKIKFLMIQRKDTMGYIDFVRGKYDTRPGYEKEKMDKIMVCLNEMTNIEKHNLLTKSFDNIWSELWVNHCSKTFLNEYKVAKEKFSNLPINDLINDSTNSYEFRELGFPKGRRNMKERNIECAEREFFEETGYDKDCYDFIKNYPIITEEFLGTNNVRYRHIYYLVKIKDKVHPPKIDLNNKVQTGEVSNIGWFTIDECLELIRPYDTAKKEVIEKVYDDIINMNVPYTCSKIFLPPAPQVQSNIINMEDYNKLTEFYTTSSDYLIDSNIS
jgi:ADP-ribose pyrophosphatase YjhB (NUDIX family)